MLSPRLRKLALTVHLTLSIGWIGAVMAYLALAVGAATTGDAEVIRSAWQAMEVVGWYSIVPLALLSLITGVVMALGTKWGLFRYYWVLISFALTAFSTLILLLHMPTVSATADHVRTTGDHALQAVGGDLLHPGIGLVVLLVIQVLNIYKPPGMTRYGWRKQHSGSGA